MVWFCFILVCPLFIFYSGHVLVFCLRGPTLIGLIVVCAATGRRAKNTGYSNPNCKALEGLTEDLNASDWEVRRNYLRWAIEGLMAF